ncbi:MAG: hypothetical protein JXA83_15495 [Acidimicrobiales bacterium]|nr:hypothetical protein [Acidimicrobiales bacterium]
MSECALGHVRLAEGDPVAALGHLRQAADGWRAVGARYDGARARVLVALAYRELGDDDTAAIELGTARHAFDELGAQPDLVRVEALAPGTDRDDHGLTARELEVLQLVSSGSTNREIAVELVLSERTVERHLSNIFTKLGVSSRAGATAYAYRHQLV